MIGKPKYDFDDIVKFEFDNKIKTGVIYIVDKYGTFEQNEEVSYDILVEEENTLYKHIREHFVVEKVGQPGCAVPQVCKERCIK